ncbi:MAG: hypothetical protein JRF02_05805 [Deltaproteobacteria bacterium]|jgi:Fe-S-cluster containining protein|nr:hypothetical protein [Deltaproteobacteria bacterium]
MNIRKSRVPADTPRKKELLNTAYGVYSRWIKRVPLACRKGCAACCTQSVCMTCLEGEVILDFIKRRKKRTWLNEKLSETVPGKNKPAVTTNQYARACLAQEEIDAAGAGSWDFTPCVFLEDNICSIYEVRPFGCRSFGSLVRCSENRAAEMAPVHLAVNTVFTQIIEHLNSDGGYWANMADILSYLLKKEGTGDSGNLLAAQPAPGFLLEPHEARIVHALLLQLKKQAAEKQTFGDLIDNFMLME